MIDGDDVGSMMKITSIHPSIHPSIQSTKTRIYCPSSSSSSSSSKLSKIENSPSSSSSSLCHICGSYHQNRRRRPHHFTDNHPPKYMYVHEGVELYTHVWATTNNITIVVSLMAFVFFFSTPPPPTTMKTTYDLL